MLARLEIGPVPQVGDWLALGEPPELVRVVSVAEQDDGTVLLSIEREPPRLSTPRAHERWAWTEVPWGLWWLVVLVLWTALVWLVRR